MSLSWSWDVGIGMYLLLFGGVYSYGHYQEGFSKRLVLVAALHSAAHMAVVFALAGSALWLNNRYFGGRDWHWLLWLIVLAIPSLTIGRWLSGKIFGLHLLVTCRYLDMNHNDAFSAMKLDSHRHFLRMQIVGDTLTLYPIKLESVPARDQWRDNPNRTNAPSSSVFVSDPQMVPEFIEAPITIHATHAPSTADVKKPIELPPKQ